MAMTGLVSIVSELRAGRTNLVIQLKHIGSTPPFPMWYTLT
jgi:hypothetical protein